MVAKPIAQLCAYNLHEVKLYMHWESKERFVGIECKRNNQQISFLYNKINYEGLQDSGMQDITVQQACALEEKLLRANKQVAYSSHPEEDLYVISYNIRHRAVQVPVFPAPKMNRLLNRVEGKDLTEHMRIMYEEFLGTSVIHMGICTLPNNVLFIEKTMDRCDKKRKGSLRF